MKTFVAGIIGLLLLAAGSSWGQTLHVLAFADTDDPDIGSNNMKTYTSLTGTNGLAATVANQAGLRLHPLGYYGANCRIDQLNQTLDALQVEPGDVVLFYFVGHGFNGRQNEYPSLIFGNANTDPATIDASARNLREIYARIRAKKPRLTIAIGDACNKERTDPPARVTSVRSIDVMPPQALNPDRFKDLFRRWQGGVLLSSSQRNQFSHTDTKGGWMSLSFQNTLNDWCSGSHKGTTDWKSMLDEVVGRTTAVARQNNQEQVPQYELDLAPYVSASSPAPIKPPPPVGTALCPPIDQFVNEIALSGIKADMPLLEDMRRSITTNNAQAYAEAFQQFYENQKPFYQTLETVLFNQINDLSPACAQQLTQETAWLTPSMKEINDRYDTIQKYAAKPTLLVLHARSELPSIIRRLREILDKLDK